MQKKPFLLEAYLCTSLRKARRGTRVFGVLTKCVLCLGILSLCLSMTFATSTSVVAKSTPTVTVIATGLNNPRNLAFGPDGALYVAESGDGGRTTGNIKCVINGEHQDIYCLGASGGVSRINPYDPDMRSNRIRILSGLGSIGPRDAAPVGGSGPASVRFDRFGILHLVTGFSLRPLSWRDDSTVFGNSVASTMSKLYAVFHRGKHWYMKQQADLLSFEQRRDPNPHTQGTNPSDLLIVGDTYFVANAGGDDVLEIRHGRVVDHVDLPPNIIDGTSIRSVPCTVARGPDGAIYIGEFTGFPFPTGGARIWRWEPGHPPTVFATGFTLISSMAFDRHGDLYVLQYASQSLKEGLSSGELIRMSVDGKERTPLLTSGLNGPAGITVACDGTVFLSDGSVTSQGRILRVRL